MDDRVTPELLGRLLDEHGGALALYAEQWTDAADDCVQEALIELARQMPAPDNPVAWLYRVVRNRAISRARSARRRSLREGLAARLRRRQWEDSEFRSLSERTGQEPAAWEETVELDELSAAVALLPDELREAVVARIWGGLNYEQIGRLAGCSTSTAHRRYLAALVALRERLQLPCPADSKMRE